MEPFLLALAPITIIYVGCLVTELTNVPAIHALFQRVRLFQTRDQSHLYTAVRGKIALIVHNKKQGVTQ